ncbi:MAG: hypothetical protein ACLQVJ_29835 [Syntrophobacteraceae bacterium]
MFDLQAVLRVPIYRSLRILLLGGYIRDRLCREIPRIGRHVNVIDHPYFFPPYEPHQPDTAGGLRFGSYGVGHARKGTDVFIRLAREVSADQNGAKHRFILVGHITDRTLTDLSPIEVSASTQQQLDRETFVRCAKEVDYAIFPYPQSSFQLTASGSLFDAFAFGRPVVALRSPLFEYYFDLMGDIGYLCDNFAELKDLVNRLCRDFPKERYQRQRDTIYHSRQIFDTLHSSDRFKRFWAAFMD